MDFTNLTRMGKCNVWLILLCSVLMGSYLGAQTVTINSQTVSAADALQGTEDQLLYRFTLSRGNPGGGVSVTGVSFSTSGTFISSDISSFRLRVNTTDNFATATQLGNDISGSASTFSGFTYSLGNNATTRYFWITADISNTATVNHTISVQAMTTSNFTTSGGTKAVGSTSAGGIQTITELSTTIASANPAVTAATLNSGSTKNPIYRFSLIRNSASVAVSLNSLAFATAGSYTASDLTKLQLWVNSSDALSTATQLGSDLSTNLGAGSHSFSSLAYALPTGGTRYFWITADISSNATSGNSFYVAAVTTGDVSVSQGSVLGTAYAGGSQSISSPTLILSSSDPAVAAATLNYDSTKNPLYQFSLTRNSVAGSIGISAISFTTAGTYVSGDIVKFQLWTNTSDSFAGASQTGSDLTTSLGTGSHSFTGLSLTMAADAVRYFWITADLSATALGDNTIYVVALTTADITTSTGGKSGSAYAGGLQTIYAPLVTLTTANPAVTAASIGIGTTENLIYRFTLSRSSYPGANTLSSVRFTTTGTALNADLSYFRLYQSSTDVFADATQLGSDITSGMGAGEHEFGSLSLSLNASTSTYFWITAGVAAGATSGRTLTVSAMTVSQFTISLGQKSSTASAGGTQTLAAVTTTISTANPAWSASNIGQSSTKNPIYRFTLTRNSVLGVMSLASISFTTGGTYQNGDLTKFQLWTATSDNIAIATQLGSDLTPGANGESRSFTSLNQALSTGVARYFWITTDVSPTATTGRTITISSMGTAGFTVSTGTKAGTTYASGAHSITGLLTTLASNDPAVAAGNVLAGSVKHPIHRFTLTRNSQTGTVNFTGLSFTTAGSYAATDIIKYQLWTSTTDALSGASQISSDITTGLGTGTRSFAAFSQALTVSSTRYFWITADISSSALAGGYLTVSAMAITNITISAGAKTGSATASGNQTITAGITLGSLSPAFPAGDLGKSMPKRALSRFTLTSAGNATLTSISFSTTGDYLASDLNKIQLYTGVRDELNAAAQIGTDITTSLGAGSHSFTSLALPLVNGVTQYFWITIDTSASAVAGNTISGAALSSSDINISSGNITGSASAGGSQTIVAEHSWLYSKSNVVNQLTNAGTGYQVKYTLYRSTGTDSGATAYLGSRCRPDFADIRFFEGSTELPYWMESCIWNSSAIFWVKLNGDLSAANRTVTVKYGNDAVTTTSNGESTFIFFDDFDRSSDTFSKWTKHKELDGSTISIPKGQNLVRMDGGIPSGTFGHSVLGSSATYSGFANNAVEFRYRVATDAIMEVGIRGTFANPGTGYKGRSDARTDTYGGQSLLSPPYYTWAHLTDADEDYDSPSVGVWYKGTITAYGTALQLFRDGSLKRSSSLGSVSGPGEISLQNHYGAFTEYDWVAVRKYANQEPTHGIWLDAPFALPATAESHEGFTARWEEYSGATSYRIDVFEADRITLVDSWDDATADYHIFRVDIDELDEIYYYQVRAVTASGTTPSSNLIKTRTTTLQQGVAANTSIQGEATTVLIPPLSSNSMTDNDIEVDPSGASTWDYDIVVTYHPEGYESFPNGRLLATITCPDVSGLNATFTINHAGMGFTPAIAAYKYGALWNQITGSFGADQSVVTISGLAKGSKATLQIIFDDGSGTLPVELSALHTLLTPKGDVKIIWVTQSETGVAGFNIYRNSSEDFPTAILISSLIPATNTSNQQSYMYTDAEILANGTYFYWLESIDFDGSNAIFGPVNIIVNRDEGNAPTPIVAGINKVYPNPFNPSTKISYGVITPTLVSLKLYNLRGQLIRTLVDEHKERGNFNIIWNGTDDSGSSVASGIYYLRLQAGKVIWQRKLSLAK